MKILKHLLSARFMAVLLFMMAIAIGIATFIENEYDTITAKVLVYNAKWFELVLLLLLPALRRFADITLLAILKRLHFN